VSGDLAGLADGQFTSCVRSAVFPRVLHARPRLPVGCSNLWYLIAEEGDHLTAQLAGPIAAPILFYGNHMFGMRFDPALRLIFEVEVGRAVKVVLLQNGGGYEGVRK